MLPDCTGLRSRWRSCEPTTRTRNRSPWGLNALLQIFEFHTRHCVGAVRDIEQHPFQVVEHADYSRFAGGSGGLPEETVGIHQIFSHQLFAREVDLGARGGVGYFDQHHLRPFEVIADGYQKNTIADLRCAGRSGVAGPQPGVASSEKC